MFRSAASKVAWVGRTASMVFGLALVLALIFGVASMALGANGDPWILGKFNAATAITSLGGAGGVNGPMVRITNNDRDFNDTALDLRVHWKEPPLRVNSGRWVANLNADKVDGKHANQIDADKVDGKHANQIDADKVDGKHANQIGVNGLQIVEASSKYDANSLKEATAQCPPGKKVVGGGAWYSRSEEPALGRRSSDEIAIQGSRPVSSPLRDAEEWHAAADWMGGDGFSPFNWRVVAYAICAQAP